MSILNQSLRAKHDRDFDFEEWLEQIGFELVDYEFFDINQSNNLYRTWTSYDYWYIRVLGKYETEIYSCVEKYDSIGVLMYEANNQNPRSTIAIMYAGQAPQNEKFAEQLIAHLNNLVD